MMFLACSSQKSCAQEENRSSAKSTPVASEGSSTFCNPIGDGADPWVVCDQKAKRYLWCLSEKRHAISIRCSKQITSLGKKRVVWRVPEKGPFLQQFWAPELHFLKGKWYIYFSASDGKIENHLAYVLQSKGADPFGPYTLFGPLATGDGVDGLSPNIWAIDMTVLQHEGKLYAIWSGWEAPGVDRQFLYIAPMKSPVEIGGPRVRLASNDDYLWERTEENLDSRGLNEGPEILRRQGRTFLVYSCGASWLPTYKLGMLELVGSDPLNPKAWKKFPKPVFQSTPETYGVGHSSFTTSFDGKQHWHVFHAKKDREPGWERSVFVQPFDFDPDGLPRFGRPVAAGVPIERE